MESTAAILDSLLLALLVLMGKDPVARFIDCLGVSSAKTMLSLEQWTFLATLNKTSDSFLEEVWPVLRSFELKCFILFLIILFRFLTVSLTFRSQESLNIESWDLTRAETLLGC